jgi:hypothetical protein
MKLTDITIPESFQKTKPSAEKLTACRKYYEENGKLPKPVVIDDHNVLVDGYIGYLTLLDLGVEETEPAHGEFQPTTVYVFGKHTPDGKEYVWYAPIGKHIGYIKEGDTILVKTKYGRKPITVTRVERRKDSPSEGIIRPIIKKISDPE